MAEIFEDWYPVTYTPEQKKKNEIEATIRAAEFTQKQITEQKRADEERKNIIPNDDGVVSVCPAHGRYFHEYDFKREKVMNREIKCPICGHQGEIMGEFKIDIPEISREWEY